MDPWKILPDEQVRYEQQFAQLNPADGFLTGQQSRDFFFKSNLAPAVLAKIWELSDLNRDGRLDRREFSVAMHLIRKKIQGLELPASLPPSMLGSPTTANGSGNTAAWGALPDLLPRQAGSPPSVMGSMPGNSGMGGALGGGDLQMMGGQFPQQSQSFMASGAGTLPYGSSNDQRSRTGSGQAQHLYSTMPGSVPTGEWAVPHPTKLKYNKMFHDLDKARVGSLSGNQARSILMQSGLPNPMLAQIWALSDIDKDGRLTSEEFVLAMHLAEMARQREPIPATLPSELIPPSFRRPRGLSANIQIPFNGGGLSAGSNSNNLGASSAPAAGAVSQEVFDMTPASFEDKRKENFDKGNAELERRRQAIQEMQRQEREEREKREREEFERREKIRLEQERKRQAELESQLARQREIQERQEEERRKVIEQREAARLEMERQRKIERQRKRRHDLMNERTREYEELAHYKSQNSGIELHTVDSDTKRADLLQLVEETRNQVRERKEIIDGMRMKRDELLEEISRTTSQEQELGSDASRAKSERAMLEGRMSISSSGSGESPQSVTFEVQRRQDAAAELQNKLSEAETTTAGLKKAIDERNSRIKTFGEQFQTIYENHVRLLHDFQGKQTSVMQSSQQGAARKASTTNVYPNLHDTAASSGSYGFSGDKDAFSNGNHEGTGGWAENNFDAPDDVWGEQSPFTDGTSAAAATDATPTKVSELRDDLAGKLVIRTPSIKHDHHLSFDNDFKQTKFRRYRALYTYTAGNEDELSFQAGDVISVPTTHDGEPGWLPGELAGKTGWLPENHVQLLPDTAEMPAKEKSDKPIPKSRGNSVQSDSPAQDSTELAGNIRAKAIHPWHAKKDSHLTFAKGDILLLKKQADNWYFGEKDGSAGQSGWFPAQCVQVIADDGEGKRAFHSHHSVDSHTGSTGGEAAESLYVSVFDYTSEVAGDLAFRAGEVVRVTHKDGDWWTGVIANRTGIFPSNYVKEHNDSPQLPSPASLGKAMAQTNTEDLSKKKPEIAVAVAAYTAGGPEQISFAKGDLILVKKKTETGWWEGELQAKGKQRQIGWFPAAYIKSMAGAPPSNNSGSATPVIDKSRTGSFSSHSGDAVLPAGTKVIALYDYVAQNSDELSFKKNDVIIIVSKEDVNWWKGVLNGKQGILPSNYVQIA
ncbi:Intersectin-2 [Hypsibius exemplaris]|uniref:Intersectin-2 n=1 Tax=Hypsibius exemplaris TaxID=2072580 RepID=A0A1W0WVJ9_HYPEX|nr:Intersectin-2 [Hypsibius exemplaris]